MDDDGLIPEALEQALLECRANGDRVKFLYTIPNFHNPAGVTLSEPRRRAIVDIADRYDLLVIEDNPYGLLGFDDEPCAALRARDAERVIYLGSFSKTFAPGLRVGWVLAPHAVREKLVLATEAQISARRRSPSTPSPGTWTPSRGASRSSCSPSSTASGATPCWSRSDALMPPGTTWTQPDGGFYVWLTLPEGLDAKLMLPRAVTARVAYVPGIGFYADGSGREYMRLSYCFPEPDRIREGVRRLARVIEAELDLHSHLRRRRHRHVPRRPGGGTPHVPDVDPASARPTATAARTADERERGRCTDRGSRRSSRSRCAPSSWPAG